MDVIFNLGFFAAETLLSHGRPRRRDSFIEVVYDVVGAVCIFKPDA